MAVYLSIITVAASGYNQVVNVGGENTNVNDGVSVSKTIEESDIENYFDITLNVKTRAKIEDVVKDADLAIVIVMDISNTMATNNLSSGEVRIKAAQDSGEKFIKNFAEFSKGVNAKREIGFVSFNTDSQEIFSLQECNDDQKASMLVNEMKNKTNSIVYENGYGSSHSRFTNMEAGLKRAEDMLKNSNVKNKYIIFLTDGFPTTYLNGSGYNGYDPYSPNSKNSSIGSFYNELRGNPCSEGTNYSDEAARRAKAVANRIKESGINIFSVGIGVSDQKVIDANQDPYIDVNLDKYNKNGGYEIGNSGEEFKTWLKDRIGSGYYYDTNDQEALFNAYKEIFTKMKSKLEQSIEATWVVEDPINISEKIKNIEFVGLYNDDADLVESLSYLNNDTNTASYSNNKILWDLKKSKYTTIKENEYELFSYTLKYRVRLQNENIEFEKQKEYDTNGKTTLTYVVRENDVLSENREIEFPVPSILGYLADFKFTKISSYTGKTLSLAKFKLYHDDTCECRNERKFANINEFYSTSTLTGIASFENIPSGHKYIIEEIESPLHYKLDDKKYSLSVNYGNITTSIPHDENNNYIFKNDIKTGNLEIKKIVTLGEENKLFNFKITALVNDGDYKVDKYLGNDYLETSMLTFKDGISEFNLKHNEKIIIYDLPVDTEYLISEEESFDYIVTMDGEKGVISDEKVMIAIFYNQKKPVSVTVKKVWKNTDSIPDSIRVQLYKNNEKVEEEIVTLSKENDWTYTWDNLEGIYEYTVDEIDELEFYTKEIKVDDDGTIIIINTKNDIPPNPSTGDNIVKLISIFGISIFGLIITRHYYKKFN